MGCETAVVLCSSTVQQYGRNGKKDSEREMASE